jgi:hypothetical protein
VPAGELHQRRHPRIDRRVGVEDVGESLARIVDAHLHHRGGRARKLAAALDLAQRRNHRVGILGELDRACVGQVFAFARQREADDDRQHPGDGNEHEGDEYHQPRAAPAIAAVAAAPTEAPLEHQAKDELGEEGDDPGDDDGDHQQAHVAVADVGQFVAEHRLDFGVVKRIEKPGGDRDRVLLLVHPRGEGVEVVILDHLELGRGNAARDAEVLEQIVEPRLLLPRHLAPAGHRVDHALVEFVGDKDPQRGAERRPWRGIEGVIQRAAQQLVGRRVDGERLAEQRAGIDEQVDQKEQADEQRDRAPLV